MGKTANIRDDVHMIVLEKQFELRKKENICLADIINESVLIGIDLVGE